MTRKTKTIVGISVAVLLIVAVLFKIKPSGSDAAPVETEIMDTTRIHQTDNAAANDQDEPEPDETEEEFPNIGKSVQDFVIGPYEVIMEAKGMLNEDELEDVALILQEKEDSTALRPTLVLLKQKDGSYKRYATSWYAIGAAYINGDYQHYDEERVTIDSIRNLDISTYGSGPVGNRFLKYRFVNSQLVLASMETYNMGAGGHTGVVYDFLKGFMEVTEVNTMKEDMPSTTTKEKLKKQKTYLFATTDPELI